MPFEMDRGRYAALYGPTVGDRFRLADSGLIAEIERDYVTYGEEPVWGWGKNLRDGMTVSSRLPKDSELDLALIGVIIMDPALGICKGSLGVKDGIIAAIGSAGNPDTADDIDLPIGTNTWVIWAARGMIATPGGVDTHVHLKSPELVTTAISAGVTTFIAAGLDQNGNNIQRYFQSLEGAPVNVGIQAKASSGKAPMRESIEAGACGLKVHEDTGAYPEVINSALEVADETGVAVALHTDGLNESGQLKDTIQAIGGRTIHAYHVEGSGGGHVPDVLALVGQPNVLSSSTNPTIPFTLSGVAEQPAMVTAIHNMNPRYANDLAALQQRVRVSTIAAESLLQEMGAISITTSDSLGMGRIGETITRTWQLADVMKKRQAAETRNDNQRILQYLAKYTINPAITHGIADYVGSLEPGKMADIVLWRREFFGVKPEMVLKSGFIAWQAQGMGNASIPNCEPVIYRPFWGGLGRAAASTSAFFVSEAAASNGVKSLRDSRRRILPVRNTRRVTKADMVRNNLCPTVSIDPKTAQVVVDGNPVSLEPVTEVAMNRLYFLT